MANRYTAAFPTVRASRQDQWRPIYRDRQSVPGPIVPMDRPLKDYGTGFDHLPIWDEQPRLSLGAVMLVGIALILASAWSMLP